MKRSPAPKRRTRLRPVSKKLRALKPQDERARLAALVLHDWRCVICGTAAAEVHHVTTRDVLDGHGVTGSHCVIARCYGSADAERIAALLNAAEGGQR